MEGGSGGSPWACWRRRERERGGREVEVGPMIEPFRVGVRGRLQRHDSASSRGQLALRVPASPTVVWPGSIPNTTPFHC